MVERTKPIFIFSAAREIAGEKTALDKISRGAKNDLNAILFTGDSISERHPFEFSKDALVEKSVVTRL
jgi:hypothetical protein